MTIRFAAKALTCALSLVCANAAQARSAVAIESAVFLESAEAGNGRSLTPASQFRPGDRIVYLVRWERPTGQGGFTVTNPLPSSVYFQGSAHPGEEVSVDGGRTWGKLGELHLRSRLATAEDVTHVRWHIAPQQAARRAGRIAYSAIVR